MTDTSRRRRVVRGVLISLLVLAVAVLVWAAAIIIPILTHQSVGGSGQEIPDSFVTHTSAEGADGRTRELSVETADGGVADLAALQPGDELVVRGSGFDAGIGIYVALCAIREQPDERPSPCLGGIPEGAESGEAQNETGLSSVWITNDWAWQAFATQRYDDAEGGTFTAQLTVPEATAEGLDCRVDRCAIATRADHTASSDRVQDLLLPVAFAE